MEQMNKLVEILNQAAEVYYNKGTELMSNKEYDALYDKLKKMEKETGIVLDNSPTKKSDMQSWTVSQKNGMSFLHCHWIKPKILQNFQKYLMSEIKWQLLCGNWTAVPYRLLTIMES